jgi:hypothetical protein
MVCCIASGHWQQPGLSAHRAVTVQRPLAVTVAHSVRGPDDPINLRLKFRVPAFPRRLPCVSFCGCHSALRLTPVPKLRSTVISSSSEDLV